MNSKTTKTDNVDADHIWDVAWSYIKTVVDTLREPFLILDENLAVLSANKTFYKVFQTTPEVTESKKIYDLGNGQWDIPKLRILLEDILPKNTYFEDFKVEHVFPQIGRRILLLNARRIFRENEKNPIMLLAMEDITKQKELEEQLREYARKLNIEVAHQTKQLELRVVELEKLNETMVGRELKMIELKKELEELKSIISLKPKKSV
ncbi:MAG: PAS domain-containing protein [Candidatus Dojkabacteria bacterium]